MFLSGRFPQCISETRRSYLRILVTSNALVIELFFSAEITKFN